MCGKERTKRKIPENKDKHTGSHQPATQARDLAAVVSDLTASSVMRINVSQLHTNRLLLSIEGKKRHTANSTELFTPTELVATGKSIDELLLPKANVYEV